MSSSSTSDQIRHAQPGDLTAILDILNHYVETHHCTFDTEPWSVEQKQDWFDSFSHTGAYQLLVAEFEGQVVGYAHSSRWRPKTGYDVTAETTVYVDDRFQAKGIGYALMQSLLSQIADSGLTSLVAGISQPAPGSNRLHESLGYQSVGTFRGVGWKFGRGWDVRWYQKTLD